MLFRSFCQHNLQYCDCLVAAYVFRMPVFLPIVYSNAFIQRRLAFKNLFFLFYRLLLDTNYYPAYCEIPYYLDSYFLYAVRVLCHYNFNHRTCRSSKQGSWLTGKPYFYPKNTFHLIIQFSACSYFRHNQKYKIFVSSGNCICFYMYNLFYRTHCL